MSNINERESWVLQALEQEKLVKCKVNFTGNSDNGDGFLGGISFVNVVGTTEKGLKKEYNLVVKDGNKSKVLRKNMSMRLAFQREIHMYEKIFPTFKEFQLEKHIEKPFEAYPKCYKTLIMDDMEVVIIENLKKIGYEIHDLKVPMNLEHLKMIFTEYGKLHALSFALRDQKPKEFVELTKNMPDVGKALMSYPENIIMYDRIYEQNLKILEDANELNLIEKYKKTKNYSRKVYLETIYESDPHSVILHGDCWNNNFLFKYKDKFQEVPEKPVLIDFQLSKLGSVAYDLAFFFYCSSGENDYQYLNELLDMYYLTLSTHLHKLGSDPEKLFSRKLLNEHWKKYCKVGLVLATFVYQLRCIKKEDLPTVGDDFDVLFDFKLNDKELYTKSILSLVKHFVDNDLI